MAYRIVLQPRAEADIALAFEFISEGSQRLAVQWYKSLKSEIASLAAMPRRYALAPESAALGFELRQLLFGKRRGKYRVVYRVVEDAKEVHVLTVRHSSRAPMEPRDLA